MASGVSVESAAINGGIVCCKTSIQELNTAAQKLQKSYQQAGSGGWKDQKYAALGGIVEECCSALTKPIEELQECMKKLEKLLQAVGEYEQVNL
jgi:hypothetical protein